MDKHFRENEEPLAINRMGGQAKVRERNRFAHGCGDSECVADRQDAYCIYLSAAESPIPEPPEGLGAADTILVPPGTVEFATKLVGGRRADRRDIFVKSFTEPLKYPRVRGCGHKFVEQTQPRHRNCEKCWNAYFWNQNALTENIARNVQEQGPEIVGYIHGDKFLKHFLRFAILLASYEQFRQAADGATEENDGQHQAIN